MSLAELQTVDQHFAADAREVFELKRSLAQRESIGATGTREVEKQLVRWRKILASAKVP